jgi:hypothetical protein
MAQFQSEVGISIVRKVGKSYVLMMVILVMLGVMATTVVIAQGPGNDEGTTPSGSTEDAVLRVLDEDGNVISPDQQLADLAKRHEGGFGGYYFHETDRSIAYVYMKDVVQADAAAEAFRAAYEGGQRNITQIIPVQGEYSFDQLYGWFKQLDAELVKNNLDPISGSVRELDNRVKFGMQNTAHIESAKQVVQDLGIPEGAVIFEVDATELLADKDTFG